MRTYTLFITATLSANVPEDADPAAVADPIATEIGDFAEDLGHTLPAHVIEATRSACSAALWAGEPLVHAPEALRRAPFPQTDLFVG